MIGQDKLIEQIDRRLEERTFPRFSIVLGERGMEHEDVARYVANYMSATYVELLDVKIDTIRHMIAEAYKSHCLTVYCIPHADDMSINAKNALLKVVEEVPNKAYFVMCLESLSNTLETIIGRAEVIKMHTCRRDDIAEFARGLYVNPSDVDEEEIEMISEICHSEGDVCYMMKHGAKNFYRYAEYVINNISKVSGAEVFKFSDKLALKDEEDKYDCLMFLRALQSVLMQHITCEIKTAGVCGKYCDCELVRCIGRYMQDIKIKGINKTMLMDNLYLEMRKIWKSQTLNNT